MLALCDIQWNATYSWETSEIFSLALCLSPRWPQEESRKGCVRFLVMSQPWNPGRRKQRGRRAWGTCKALSVMITWIRPPSNVLCTFPAPRGSLLPVFLNGEGWEGPRQETALSSLQIVTTWENRGVWPHTLFPRVSRFQNFSSPLQPITLISVHQGISSGWKSLVNTKYLLASDFFPCWLHYAHHFRHTLSSENVFFFFHIL